MINGLINKLGIKPSERQLDSNNPRSDQTKVGQAIFADLIGSANDNDDLQIEAEIGQFTQVRKRWTEDGVKFNQPKSELKLKTFTNLKASGCNANVTILAVKPNLVHNALTSFKPKDESLLISVAAGITISTLEGLVGLNKPIVRSMPNTPALTGKGATVVKSNVNVNEDQKKMVEELFGAVGIVRWIESEEDLDAVTAISGSGPAYFFLFAELIEKAAIQIGLDQNLARELSLQTFYGSALLLENSSDSAKTLREKVTSPGGTTEKALAYLETNNLYSLLLEAIMEAKEQAQSLSKQ